MNSYNENDRMDAHHDFDYKPKLLGILPQNYVYKKPERFETSELLLCKRPSEQQWMRGALFTSDHPSLIGQGIIEKKLQSSDSHQPCSNTTSNNTSFSTYNQSDNETDEDPVQQQTQISHLESQLSNLWGTDLNDRVTSCTRSTFVDQHHHHHHHNNDDAYFTHGSSEGSFNSVYHAGGGDNNDNEDNASTDSAEEEVKNIFNSGSPAMKFLKNNFQPNSDVLPDFTCNRNVLVNLMTEPNDFVIQATKQKFISRLDHSGKEFSTIELYFRPIRWKSDFEDINSSAIRIVTAIQSKTEIPYVNGKVVNESPRPPTILVPPQISTSSTSSSDSSDRNWRRAGSNYTADFPRLNPHHHEGESYNTNPMDKMSMSCPISKNDGKSSMSVTPGMIPRFTPYKSWDRVDRETVSGTNLNLETESTCEVDSDIESELTETPYYAFLQGKITKIDTHRQELSQSFTFNFGMYVDGVWVNKSNPYNFTCSDLAEVKTAKSTTLKGYGVGRDFYKQVRMAQNWSQTYLSGIKQYMVGVTGPSGQGNENERAIEELLLYSVDKVPEVVKLAAEQNGFKPWTPKELQSKLFSYLKDICAGMSSKPHGTPVNFFHYHGTSFLTVMTNAEVHDSIRCLQENRKKVLLKGLQTPPPLAIEDRQNAFDDAQILTLLNFIKWPINKFGKPIVKRFNREIQLTFETELLATVFSRLVKSVWRFKNSLNIPPGLERLWIEIRPITKRHENAILVNKRISSGNSHNNDPTGDKFVSNIHNNSIPIIDNRFTNQQKPRKLANTTGLYPRSMWNTNN